jgi:hypothetical protein
MKKLLLFFITTLLIISFIGCGGSNPPKEQGVKIKFYKSDGDTMESQISIRAQSVELSPGNRVFLFGIYNVPTLQAVISEDGVQQTTQLDIVEDYSGEGESHCFNPTEIGSYYTGFGTGAAARWCGPGKSKFLATYQELSGYINIFCYDSYGTLGATSGLRLEDFNNKHISNVKSDCFIWSEPLVQGYTLTGKSYIVQSTSISTWKNDLYNIKTVDIEALEAGIINRKIVDGYIYIAKNPYSSGGYVKICKVPQISVRAWDYTTTTEFRQ